MTSSVILYIMVYMGQTKYYELSICCFCVNHVALKVRAKTGLLRIRLMCPSGATCLLAGSYFTEQALLKSKSALTIYKDKRVKLMLHSIIKFNNHLCHEYMYGKYENHQNCKRSYLDQYGTFSGLQMHLYMQIRKK
jgi:hypothetical protein